MFRAIRRLLVLAIASALSTAGAANAGLLTAIPTTTAGVLTRVPCPAVTPVIHDLRVIGAPTAGTGNSCTNDVQCNELQGEACTFALGETTGTCQSSGYLQRGDVHYVAGSLVDVEVTIPTCTDVSRVQGVTLLGGSGFDGQAALVSWSFLPNGPATTVNGQTAIRQRVRIQFPNTGDGGTGPLPIEVTARTGGATTTRSFNLSGVAAVDAAIRNTIAETTIRNGFVTGIYKKFGDYEQVYNSKGELDAYDVDWSELSSVSSSPPGPIRWRGTDLRVRVGKLVFAAGFKADRPGCNPNVFVNGEFQLVPAGDSIALHWIHGPIADTDAPTWCTVLTAGFWDNVISAFADEKAIAAPFAKAIESKLEADESGRIKVCDLCKVTDVQIGRHKVEIWTNPPAHRVRVNVSSTRGTDATANPSQGLMIPAGFYAPLAGGGTFESCVPENGQPASCDKLTVDMDGAFNWWGTDVPVPDSIVYNQYGTAAVLGGRANARARLKGVTRHTASLPAPTFPADALIARRSNSSVLTPTTRARVSNGCVLPPVTTGSYRIAFGVNDLWNTPPTSGKLQATVLLADTEGQSAELFGSSKTCTAAPSSGGVLGATTGTLSR